MVDFTKLNISYLNKDDLLNDKKISWEGPYSDKQGNILYPIKGTYYNLGFKVYKEKITLEGSLHKFYNEIERSLEDNNSNDYSYQDFTKTVERLKQDFNLDPHKTTLENLEFGINLNISTPPEKIIRENLINKKSKVCSKNFTYEGKGKLAEFKHSQGYFKIYDKGLQERLHENILRIEFGSIKTQYLEKNLQVRKLSHLMDHTTFTKFALHLKKQFNECLILDEANKSCFNNESDYFHYITCYNPKTWEKTTHKVKRKRLNDKIDCIVKKYGLDTVKQSIITEFEVKVQKLLECNLFTDLQSAGKETACNDFTIIDNVKGLQTKIKCIITGVDISIQKTNNKYILETTITYYQKVNPYIYNKILRRFMNKKLSSLPKEKVNEELAHRIRRKYQSYRSNYNGYLNSLFPYEV